MNKGKYFDSVNKAYSFLKHMSLVKEKNVAKMDQCSSDKFSKIFKKMSKKERYIEIYKKGIEDNEYDILLIDSSFIQFSFDEEPGIIRYAYYPNPNQVKSYEEFLNKELESCVEEVGDTCRDLYEQYVEEQAELIQVTSFRYDYNTELYDDMVHSAAHFHFGGEDIRVPCDRVLTPFSFVILVIHYYYGSKWKESVRDEKILLEILNAKGQCEPVIKKYFSQKEQKYFYVG